MSKFLSLVLFLAALISSWSLFHSHDIISQATHARIQNRFVVLIAETLKQHRPNSTDLKIVSLYTQKIDDNQIRAHFSYIFKDQLEGKEPVTQSVEGDAYLYRGLSENPADEKWIAKNIKTNSNSIEFQQELVVTPAKEDDPKSAPTTENKTN